MTRQHQQKWRIIRLKSLRGMLKQEVEAAGFLNIDILALPCGKLFFDLVKGLHGALRTSSEFTACFLPCSDAALEVNYKLMIFLTADSPADFTCKSPALLDTIRASETFTYLVSNC